MRADLLHVVTCYFNPLRWQTRNRLAREHLKHLLDSGVQVTLVECQTGDRPFEFAGFSNINHVPVRSKTLVWNKENLLRIGMSRITDPDWKYVCWTDADIKFRRPNWAAETVQYLQQYDVIQPWSDAYDLGPDDAHLAAHKSFLSLWWNGKSVVYGIDPEQTAFGKRVYGFTPTPPIHNAHPTHNKNHEKETRTPPKTPWWRADGGSHEYPHTGYAWAATRNAIDSVGGLFDLAALGAADYHMALALVGYAEKSLPGVVNAAYRKHLFTWQERALHHINFNLGYLPGTIEHTFHGAKADRRYIDRWQIILEHDFDPDVDIQRNAHGVIELRCTKPRLRHDIDLYLRQRNEDATTL